MKYFSCWILLLCLMLASCTTEPPQQAEQPEQYDEETTEAVLQHHWEAFKAHDMEEVMADYTEESLLITPDTTWKGLDAIRENFRRAFAGNLEDKTFVLKKSVVEQDIGYILWQVSTPSAELIFATDTFVIRDGKIIRQTYGGVTREQADQLNIAN